jgi:hypothetical protein
MLEFIRPYLEAEAASRGKQQLAVLRVARDRNQAFWFSYVCSSWLGLVALIAGATLAAHLPRWYWQITITSILITLVIATVGVRLRTNSTYLVATVRRYGLFRNRLSRRMALDFLASYAWAAYGLVLAPAIISIFAAWGLSRNQWSFPGSEAHKAYTDTLKQLMTLVGAVLAAQVALFNFMFAQLLGKYSSLIVIAVVEHRVVRLLRGFIVTMLVILYLAFCLGFPISLPKATIWLLLSILSAVVLTVRVATRGVEADSAMRYAGTHIARIVRRKFKTPLPPYTAFWKIIAWLALDWRNPERMVPIVQPQAAANTAVRMVTGIFNAAHKAAQENQHEMFFSALEALTLITDSYVQGRSKYFGTSDSFIEYMVNQFSSLLKAASKSANETLITNVITHCSTVGKITLRLGTIPDEHKIDVPISHAWFVHWFGLLNEGFTLSHTLQRSTAASESITQMSLLTNSAVQKNFAEAATITFLPEISKIHTLCLLLKDPYHTTLAGECLVSTFKVWIFSITQKNKAWAHISEGFADAVQEMALRHHSAKLSPSFDLMDPASILTVKVAEDSYTLQDICLSLLHRQHSEGWEKRHAVDQVIRITELLTTLIESMDAKAWAPAKSYLEALYEIAFLVFRGLPQSLTEPSRDEIPFEDDNGPQKQLENAIENAISKILGWSEKGKWSAYGTEQTLFALIGLAATSYKTTGRLSLKSIAIQNIQGYAKLLDKALHDDSRIRDQEWDYLQLCAAWTSSLLGESELSKRLVEKVANFRPFVFGGSFSSRSGRYGSLGYPRAELGMDFYLPVPRNIMSFLGDADQKQFESWQALAMDSKMLMDTYVEVEEIRKPIRERLSQEARTRPRVKRQDHTE